MNKERIQIRPLKSTDISIIFLGMGASLAGSFAFFAGGFGLAVASAVLIGSICLVFFLFMSGNKKLAAVPGVFTVETVPVQTLIPADRIDDLTGLANENGLFAWFSEKGAKLAADGKGIVVLAADLADFDQVERSRGKETAESVLKEVAKRVASCTGEDGIAARTSGDEFAAVATVVPSHSAELAAEQAGKLAEMLQRPVELPTGVIWIGGSVGAAYGSPLEGAAVLERAREALKKAKRLGRGHYVVDNTPKLP